MGKLNQSFELGMRGILGGMFVLAAISKAWNLSSFAVLLSYMLHLPATASEWMVGPALALTAWEALLGGAIALFHLSRWVRTAVILTLAAFTVILVLLMWDPRHPSCGCFGAVVSGRKEAPLGVLRNIAAIVLMLCLSRAQSSAEEAPAS